MKPLNIGNTVTLSIQLYRHYFWQSFRLSLIAFLWLLIPIYGWAKSCETLALISRLAWNHLGNSDEEFPKAAKTLSRRTWTIFLSHILVGSFNLFMAIAVVIVLSILLLLVLIVLFVFVALTTFSNSASENLIYWLSLLNVFLCFFLMPLSMLWLYSRLFLFEAVLAIETEVTVWKSIRESWKLTRKQLPQIQGVVAIVWVLSAMTFLVTWFVAGIVLRVPIASLNLDPAAQRNLVQICFYVIYSFSLIFIQPIWQNAKTVLYLDCKNRREGLDLSKTFIL